MCERYAFSVVYTLLITITKSVLELTGKGGHPLADLAGRALRRYHHGGLLPSLKHLLIENGGTDGGKRRNSAPHVIPVMV